MVAFGADLLPAQSTPLTSSATIETPITATGLSGLNFGTVVRGATTSIPASHSGAALIRIDGDPLDNVSVTIPEHFTVRTSSGNGGQMTVSLRLRDVRYSTTNIQNLATRVDILNVQVPGTLVAPLSAADVLNGSLGYLYIWLGADLTPAQFQQRGVYSGTLSVQAAYSN